ncbi:MAG: PP2C family protein-serine/threonine phosphatase, partial [Opitutales bacterium]
EKLTIDHTMEQELIDEHGEAARKHMPREYPHTLTRCIGQEGQLRVDQTRVQLEVGDRVLLCTDGLNKVVPTSEITEILGANLGPDEIAIKLTEMANERSGPDNITVITLHLS